MIGNDPRTSALATNFDALQELITQAHSGSPRIQVHCWVTTHLVWSGFTPPAQPDHVLNVRPDLLTRDSSGGSYLAEGYYLDPGHPDATLWNYVMATNIVRRYDVDGFHWDYIRYPQQDSGYNPTAVARYNAEFALTGMPSAADPQFSDWRRRQVTDFLRWVNADLLAAKSNLVISCAVFSHREDAYLHRFQDWAAWNQEGIIDVCMPMGYTPDNAVFQTRLRDAAANQGVRTVYFGQAAYLNPRENTLWQLRLIRQRALPGSVFYSYRVPNSGRENRSATFSYLRTHFQPAWVDVPEIPWKTSPTNGILRGTVTEDASGAAVYNATVALNTLPARSQQTGSHGTFAFFETPPGDYTVIVSAAHLGTVTTNVTITAGQNRALALVMPPTLRAGVLTQDPPIIPVGVTNLAGSTTNSETVSPTSLLGPEISTETNRTSLDSGQ
jgi:uncharacterized lipoprotein YddW (UPF0748 family)